MVMTEVVPHLYMGSLEDAKDKAAMKEFNIRAVVSIGCPTPVNKRFGPSRAYENILDCPEESLFKILADTNRFIQGCIWNLSNVLVHCVYGQSRSAAVVASYLFTVMEVSMAEVLSFLKGIRPIICINPGFLAQLHLLSVRGLDAPEIRLIRQNPWCFNTDTYEFYNHSRPSKFHEKNYEDCFKYVKPAIQAAPDNSADPGPDSAAIGDGSHGGNRAVGKEDALVGDSSTDDVNVPEGAEEEDGKLWTVLCRGCNRVLADEEDIVAPVHCEAFLDLHTDDYWRGYKALHPPGTDVILLDAYTEQKASKTAVGYLRHIIDNSSAAAQKNVEGNGKNKNKRKIDHSAPKADTDICIIGPVDWVKRQLGEIERPARRDETENYLIVCPKCRVQIGCSRVGGLDICSSFLRCDLIALKSAKIIYVRQ